jgi:two-component system, OmpR family, sensor histidine kinase KdpD
MRSKTAAGEATSFGHANSVAAVSHASSISSADRIARAEKQELTSAGDRGRQMVGVVGEAPWLKHDNGHRGWVHLGWLAKARAAIVALFRDKPRSRRQSESDSAFYRPTKPHRWVTGLKLWWYGNTVLLVALAAVVCLLLRPYLAPGSLVLPFLIAILLIAIAYGLLPSLVACVLSVLTFDFFFLPPFYSLNVSEPDDVLRLIVFGLTAVIVSNLAAYARRQAVTASLRAEVAEDLYSFGRHLAGAATLRQVLDRSLPKLTAMLGAPVLIVLPDDGGLAIYPAVQYREWRADTDAAALTGEEFSLVRSWLRETPPAAADTSTRVSPRWLFVSMRTGLGKVGVLAISREAVNDLKVPNSEALLGTLADLLAQAIHRIDLADDLTLANRAAEREELHAALLASLSHDLRSPLSSVIAAAESLVDYPHDRSGEEQQQSLARSIRSEARRLDRYIGDLLDMTRLESGLVHSTTSRIDLADAVSVALDRCAAGISTHRVTVELAADLPLLAGDEVLLEHVLYNVLDNAAKYAPAGSLIQLFANRDHDSVVIEIVDEGGGIRPADLERVFDKFYRGKRQGPESPGIGLGLAICRGYVEAMGGRISARNRTGRGGAVFVITLPIPAEEDLPDLET